MFPICFKNDSFREPVDSPVYFLLAENGVFLAKEMELYKACIKVEGIPWHATQSEFVELKFPKIPTELVEKCMAFFYAVYDSYKSEGIVLLYFSPTRRAFRVRVPRQHVRRPTFYRGMSYSVHYEIPPTPHDFIKLGTWHSHADLRACHSGLDDEDESTQDGLHIVVGDLDTSHPSFSLSFMVNGKRFALERDQVFEDYSKSAFPVPAEWLEQVEWLEPTDSEFHAKRMDRNFRDEEQHEKEARFDEGETKFS